MNTKQLFSKKQRYSIFFKYSMYFTYFICFYSFDSSILDQIASHDFFILGKTETQKLAQKL